MISESDVQERPRRSGWFFPLAVVATLLLLGIAAMLARGIGQGKAISTDAAGEPKLSALPSPTTKDSSQSVSPGVNNEPVQSAIPSPTAKESPQAVSPDVNSEPVLSTIPAPTAEKPSTAVADTPTPTGPVAPDFTLPDLDGAMWSLSQFRGRPVVLFFWATW